jgi:hypothetical protein
MERFDKIYEISAVIINSLPNLKGVDYKDFVIDAKAESAFTLQLRRHVDDIDQALKSIVRK